MSRSEFGRTSSGVDLSLDKKALLSIYRECLPWAAKVGGLKDSELQILKLEGIDKDQTTSHAGPSSKSESTDARFLEADAKRREKRIGKLQIAEYAGRQMDVDQDLKTLINNEWEKPKSRVAVIEKLMDVGKNRNFRVGGTSY